MAGITAIPSEIMLEIVEQLDLRSQFLLLRTCRRFAWLLTPVLYDQQLKVPQPPHVVIDRTTAWGGHRVTPLDVHLARFMPIWKSEFIMNYFQNLSSAYVDRRCPYGKTWLHHAAAAGRADVVEILLYQGAEINAPCEISGSTPICEAIFDGNEDVIGILLEAGANPLEKDSGGSIVARNAALSGSVSLMERCLEIVKAAGGDIDFKGNEGATLLDAACRGSAPMVRFLLQLGANPLEITNGNVLYTATMSGQVDTCRLIMDKVMDLTGGDLSHGVIPLHTAIDRSKDEAAQYFIDRGVDVLDSANGNNSPSIFLLAFIKGNKSAVERMLDVRPELWQRPVEDVMRQFFGPQRIFPHSIDILLDLFKTGKTTLDFSFQDERNNYTLLHRVVESCGEPQSYKASCYSKFCKCAAIACVQRLADETGVDVTCRSNTGQTPLHIAIEMGKFEFARVILLATPARFPELIHTSDQQGRTPLHLAAASRTDSETIVSQLLVINLLLEAGAEINCPDSRGRTPLHAAAVGNRDIIHHLVKRGANIRALDKDGLPPQHLSTVHGLPIWFWDFLSDGKGVWHQNCNICGKAPFPLDPDGVSLIFGSNGDATTSSRC